MQAFVSHSSADKPLIRQIAGAVEDAGLIVWLDEARIRVGDSIPEAVGEALSQSDLLLFGFSRSALASRWVSKELNTFVMQAMRDGRPILPCRLDESQPPTLVADPKYADFSASFDVGMAALLGAVGVAEEIALQRRVEEVARSLEDRITDEGQRAWFYEMFVRDDSNGPFCTTSDSYDNRLRKAERWYIQEMERLGIFTEPTGWHEDDWMRENVPSFATRAIDAPKMQWLVIYLSPLGLRIISRWRSPKSTSE